MTPGWEHWPGEQPAPQSAHSPRTWLPCTQAFRCSGEWKWQNSCRSYRAEGRRVWWRGWQCLTLWSVLVLHQRLPLLSTWAVFLWTITFFSFLDAEASLCPTPGCQSVSQLGRRGASVSSQSQNAFFILERLFCVLTAYRGALVEELSLVGKREGAVLPLDRPAGRWAPSSYHQDQQQTWRGSMIVQLVVSGILQKWRKQAFSQSFILVEFKQL